MTGDTSPFRVKPGSGPLAAYPCDTPTPLVIGGFPVVAFCGHFMGHDGACEPNRTGAAYAPESGIK